MTAVSDAMALARRAERAAIWRGPFIALAVIATALACAAALGFGRVDGVQSFSVVFLSIVFEAMPFVLLGSVVSAGLETFARDRVERFFTRIPGPLAVPGAALLGFLFPVCECGSVPVARRLARRGLAPPAALAFMLAAPVVNPVVILSTAIAFRNRMEVVWGRVVVAYAVALIAAWVMAPDARQMFGTGEAAGAGSGDGPGEHNSHEHGAGFGHVLIEDVTFMFRYLVVGAILAALFQTLVPRSIIDPLGGSLLGGIFALMAFAMLLSICSEADAFVAASLTSFRSGATVSFLVFGPMIDLKLLAIYSGAFGRRAVQRLTVAVAAPVVLGAVWFEVLTT